jgi:hypothetical protein
MSELGDEVPDVHPLYRDPVQGWTCLRHGGCAPAVALRNVDQWHVTFPPTGPTRVAQHTWSQACDGAHEPGPCP